MRLLCWLGLHRWKYTPDDGMRPQTVRRCRDCNKVQTWDYLLAREKGVIRWRSL